MSIKYLAMPTTLFDTSTFTPLFTKLLEIRGFKEPSEIETFISSELKDFDDPFKMKGMHEAVRRLTEAVSKEEKILVHGDYDIDGITGSAIVAKTLLELGASVEVFLPDRRVDGYGVSLRAIEKAKEDGCSLFITVDCGITAHKQITRARELGLDVLVIDHHRIPEEGLPPATIILNPLQEGCPYIFKELSAGGLAFKLGQALLGEKAIRFLDLAALSTIGDVAPLKLENRIIVKHGLEELSKRATPGIKALSDVANIRSRKINVGHVGFMMGPRINAAGRMSTPEIALRLLMSQSSKEAGSLATVLDEENKARQKEERQTVKEAIEEVEKTMNFSKDRVIVVGKQGWHAGVIGIVASRLVDRFYRPALVIALDGETGKASARSIKGFHLVNALRASKDHLMEFGGHEQAAGFSIETHELENFRRKINDYAREEYEGAVFARSVKTDLEISFEDLSDAFVKELLLLEPHGMGNSRPIFRTQNLQLKGSVEKKYAHSYKFWLTDGRAVYPAGWMDKAQTGGISWLVPNKPLDIAYAIKIQTWDGIDSLTLDVRDIKPQL